jgi:hypothetical protein
MNTIRGHSGEIYLDGVKIGDVQTTTIDVSNIPETFKGYTLPKSFSGTCTMTGFLHDPLPYDLYRLSLFMHKALIKSRNERIRKRLVIYHNIQNSRRIWRESFELMQSAVDRAIANAKKGWKS